MQLCRRLEDVSKETATTMNLGSCLLMMGRIPEGVDLLNRSRQLALETGNLRLEAYSLAALAGAADATDDLPAAVTHRQRGLAAARRLGACWSPGAPRRMPRWSPSPTRTSSKATSLFP